MWELSTRSLNKEHTTESVLQHFLNGPKPVMRHHNTSNAHDKAGAEAATIYMRESNKVHIDVYVTIQPAMH